MDRPDSLSIILVLSVMSSAALLAYEHTRDNLAAKIQLPVHLDSLDSLPSSAADISNAITLKDVSEGEMLHVDEFWKQMRLRKLGILFCLVASTVLQGTALGISAVEDSTAYIAVIAVAFVSSVYNVFVAWWSLLSTEVIIHWRLTLHLTGLILINVVVLALQASLTRASATTEWGSSGADTLMVISTLFLFLAGVVTGRTRRGPDLHFWPENIYTRKDIAAASFQADQNNVSGLANASPWETLFMSYTSRVANLSQTRPQLQITDLPLLPFHMRAAVLFTGVYGVLQRGFTRKAHRGVWDLTRHLALVNSSSLIVMMLLAVGHALLCFAPMFFLSQFLEYLQNDPGRKDKYWGWMFCAALVFSDVVFLFFDNHIQYAAALLQSRIRVQLNAVLFAKTLTRKDVSTHKGEDDVTSKAQILTLMTSDVDRVVQFIVQLSTLIGSPLEITFGFLLLFKLLGPSTYLGIAAMLTLLPVNHYAGNLVGSAQAKLMATRDERLAITNEVLVGIRMLKFMAWENKFEQKVLDLRTKELQYQRLTFLLEMALDVYWSGAPLLVLLLTLWHFTIVRGEALTPAIAFAVISVLQEMRYGLNAIPETVISLYQSRVSLRRLAQYLHAPDASHIPSGQNILGAQNATITWPQAGDSGGSNIPTPHSGRQFSLANVSTRIPEGKFTLVCGKTGSGKTLFLLGLLGEAELLSGQVFPVRSPQDTIFTSADVNISDDQWILPNTAAYVSQTAWLENASIKENILFGLPMSEKRYRKTLQVCTLTKDIEILEDGDETEIGERGINISGGQKARVTLARAVYSRASVLLLDDVLAAVDAHTVRSLYHHCLRGDLLRGRTVVLVTHHVQLCSIGADHIIVLDKGSIHFQGSAREFNKSGLMWGLVSSVEANQPNSPMSPDRAQGPVLVDVPFPAVTDETFGASPESFIQTDIHAVVVDAQAARVLVEAESRATGTIGWAVWRHYLGAYGGSGFWILFTLFLAVCAVLPVIDNKWLQYWSNAALTGDPSRGTLVYFSIYALIMVIQLVIENAQALTIYEGSLRASSLLYKKLLNSVLFAKLRFHDTVSKGRLLSRFGADFGGLDNRMAPLFRRTTNTWAAAIVALLTIVSVGGLPFLVIAVLLILGYWNAAKTFRVTSRELRRIEASSQAPLYTMYGDAVSGVLILRAFGATASYMRRMLRFVDTNTTSFFWTQAANQWVTLRLNLISGLILAATTVIVLLSTSISAALAGFVLSFATMFANHVVGSVRVFVILEQNMVAVERIAEFSNLPLEDGTKKSAVELAPTWPTRGALQCENLHVPYSPGLPDVLHDLNFTVDAGEKIGILGRTGSGKTTLALSFLRFMEAREGRILVDGIDIALLGLSDLRSRITIIPQDPVILSGTLRSALDLFNEYDDADIFDALRRVHLIGHESESGAVPEHEGVFRNLSSLVTESGSNFSAGERQLICMARAILKRSKVLLMDEATASIDVATDQLISQTIKEVFADSTILTIAHRLRTVMNYDRVMVLDAGRLIEFDNPSVLLDNPGSKFYELCMATGDSEFAALRSMLDE